MSYKVIQPSSRGFVSKSGAVIGADEVIRVLEEIRGSVEGNEMRRGFFRAGNVLAAAGRRSARLHNHYISGSLISSLRVRVSKKKTAAVVVGFNNRETRAVELAKTVRNGIVPNAAWIDEGTPNRKGTGVIIGSGFWRSVQDSAGREASEKMREEVQKIISKRL